MQPLKISIVTPSYNQRRFIERTINSILGQNYSELELIVMDGGSTDGTIDILKKFGDRIIWRSEKDRGQSDAINKGLRLATGDIVAYLCSDDTYQAGALQKVAEFFQNNPQTKWVYGKCRMIDENDREIRKPITRYKNFMLRRYSYPKLLVENYISQPATFWRRSLLDELGFINENEHLCMDYEYWLRLGQRYPAGVINSYLANFRHYTTSKSGSRFTQQFRDELRVAKKYSAGRPGIQLLHKLNYYKIVGAYRLIGALQGKKSQAKDSAVATTS
jgi:glycosyltransferase involved in cell wall biosynthesis